MRDAIVEAAGALFTIGALGYVLLVIWYLMTHQEETPKPNDPDFEEFYLDLCQFDLTVDFTREEAEELYRTWQRHVTREARIVKTQKGD